MRITQSEITAVHRSLYQESTNKYHGRSYAQLGLTMIYRSCHLSSERMVGSLVGNEWLSELALRNKFLYMHER
jgi:hypothetical protein